MIFLQECLWRNFLEGFFVRTFFEKFLGGFFWEKFFLGGIFWKELFGRNYLFTLLKLFEYERDWFVCQDSVSRQNSDKQIWFVW